MRIFKNISLLFLTLIMVSCGSKKEEVKVERLRPVNSMEITESSRSNTYTFSGTTKAQLESKLSFRVGGTVELVKIKVGDLVKKGQLLAKLDPTDLLITFRQTQAQLKATEVQFINARSNYLRVEKLYENNSLSLSDFEKAKAGFEQAKAEVQAAKEQLAGAKRKVDFAQLKAPFSGIITEITVEENEEVATSSSVFRLSAMDLPEIFVGIPENFIANVNEGMSAKITFSTLGNKELNGHITEVGYSTVGGSTYPVTVQLDETDALLRPGMPADVFFTLENQQSIAIVVPASAVGEDTKGRFVFTLKIDSEQKAVVKKQYVTIGDLTEKGFEIKTGLEIGQTIATAGLSVLLEGDHVKVNN